MCLLHSHVSSLYETFLILSETPLPHHQGRRGEAQSRGLALCGDGSRELVDCRVDLVFSAGGLILLVSAPSCSSDDLGILWVAGPLGERGRAQRVGDLLNGHPN